MLDLKKENIYEKFKQRIRTNEFQFDATEYAAGEIKEEAWFA